MQVGGGGGNRTRVQGFEKRATARGADRKRAGGAIFQKRNRGVLKAES